MTWRAILILPFALGVASCVSPGSNCAGWEAITTEREATIDHLVSDDPAFLAQIVTHNEFGQKAGCWK